MSAFDNAKAMGYAALVEKIQAASLKDYGLCPEPFMDNAFRAAAKEGDAYVYAGLNNADVDLALLDLLKEKAEKVLSGIEIAGMLCGAAAKFLYLPAEETALTDSLRSAASAHNVILVNDIINVREAEQDLILHIATACDLADIADGEYAEGIYVKTDEKPLAKVPADTPVSELVSLDGAKAVYLGYQYFTPDEAKELTAKDCTSGYVKVLTEKNCIVAETAKILGKYRIRSCGRCVFCREGLIQLEYMQKEVAAARGKTAQLDLTREIGEPMTTQTLCTVGQFSPLIALSAVNKFGSEFEAHIKKNKCPAGVCGAFVHIYIDPHTCTGCEECTDVCPANCIEGKAGFIHMIDEFECTKCGKCIEACEEEAIIMTAGKLPKLPTRLMKVGKFKKH